MKRKMTYDAWFKKACMCAAMLYNISLYDINDYPYHDWYNDGTSPKGAAMRAVKMAMRGD